MNETTRSTPEATQRTAHGTPNVAGEGPETPRQTSMGLGLGGVGASLALGYLLLATPTSGTETETSTRLVLLLFAAAIALRWRALLRTFGPPGALGPTVALLAGAAALRIWAGLAGAPDLAALSLILAVSGSSWALGGRHAFRGWMPSTLLLLFLFSLPAVVRHQLVYPMQIASASLASNLLTLAGLGHARSGDMLITSTNAFRVVESCSGLASVEALSLAAVFYLVVFRPPLIQTLLTLLVAPGLGFLMNGLRVAWLTLSQPTGALESHSTQGLIVVILGALALGGWIRLLGHIPSRAPRNPQPSERVQAAATLPRTRVLGLIVLFVSLGLSPRLPPPLNGPSSMAQAALEQRTRGLAGRADLETALDLEFLGSVEAGAWLQRTFEVEGRSVTLYVGADDQRNRTQSLRSPKTAYPGSGWMLLEQRPLSIEAGSPRIEASVMRSPNGRQLVYHWTEGYGSLSTAGLRAWLALDQTLGSDAPVAFTMRLSTSLDASPTARFAADDRLRDVMGRLSPPSSSRSPRRVRRPGRRRPSRARTASERSSDARSSPTSRGSDSGVLQ